MQVGIVLDVIVERFQIAESLLFSNREHLGFDVCDTLQAEVVNPIGREIGGGLVADGEAIARFSIRQGPDAGIEAAVRGVILAHEFREFRVGGRDFGGYDGCDLVAELLARIFRNSGGELAQWFGEWTLVERIVGDSLRLVGDFFEQKSRRYEMIAQAIAHASHGLIEHTRNLVQTRYVILVILDVAEWRIVGQQGVAEVNAAKLAGGHFPVFELRGVELLMQAAQHERVVEALLLRETGDVDGLEACERDTRVFEIVGEGLIGEIAKAIVVAIVSYLRGELGLSAQRVLPLLGKQAIEFGAAGIESLFGGVGEWSDES